MSDIMMAASDVIARYNIASILRIAYVLTKFEICLKNFIRYCLCFLQDLSCIIMCCHAYQSLEILLMEKLEHQKFVLELTKY